LELERQQIQLVSLLSVDHSSFVISTVKADENGNGWLVHNISSEPIQVNLKPFRCFTRTALVNLVEEEISPFELNADGSVKISTSGHQIVSVLFFE